MSAPAAAVDLKGGRVIAPVLVAIALTVLLLWLAGRIADILILLFLGILLSLFLSALADLLTRHTRLSRQAGFVLAVVLVAGAVTGILWLVVPPVVAQTQSLFVNLPTVVAGWEERIQEQLRRLPGLQGQFDEGEHTLLALAYEQAGAYFGDVIPKLIATLNVAVSLFSVVIMSIYFGLTPGLYREWLIALFPPVHRDLVRDLLGDLGSTLRAWIVGQLLTMTILAALTAVGYYLLGVPYWLTFGVFTGLVSIVPFFGTIVSTLLPALFVLAGPGGETRALAVILLGLFIHAVESNILMPRIQQHQVELPPVLSITAVLVFGKLLGAPGLLVAVPALAVIMVVVRRLLINRIYEGQGFRRAPRDRVLVLRVPAPRGGVLLPPGDTPDLIALAQQAGDTRAVA